MKSVSKEYFACKCLEEISRCQYFYRKQIKGLIDYVKHRFQITVSNLTDGDLENYVAEEVKRVYEMS